MKISTRQIVESALMIAIASVLSLITFSGPWALGGGITVCSMLPLVILSHRFGVKAGLTASVIYGLIQMLLGFSNVQYAQSFMMAVGIVFLDYIIAFGVIGLSSMFNGVIKNRIVSVIVGIAFSFSLRFVCHFISGWWIWESLWPNELGWAAPIWSLAYNASYMLPEIIITCAVAALSYKPLSAYWQGKMIR
ncbi:MAG: energy-coupled thiamine transporter ThiT [Clostridia bacterium]|nr:energy-coupled thiamine transporter ThiT [Clostridia bacterium]